MHIENIRLALASQIDMADTLLDISFDRQVNLFIGPNSTGKSSLIGTLKDFNSFISSEITGSNGEAVNLFAINGLDPSKRDNPLVRQNIFPVFDPPNFKNSRDPFADSWLSERLYFTITPSSDWDLYLERYFRESYFEGHDIREETSEWIELEKLHSGEPEQEPTEVVLVIKEYRLSDSVPFLYVPAVRLNLSGLKASDWTRVRDAANTFKHLPGISSPASVFKNPMETLFDVNSEVFCGQYVEFVIQWLRETMGEDKNITQSQIYQLRTAVELGYSCSKRICSEIMFGNTLEHSADYPKILPSAYLVRDLSNSEVVNWVSCNDTNVFEHGKPSYEELAHGNFPLRYSYPFKIMNDYVTVIAKETDEPILVDGETEVFIQINDEEPGFWDRHYGRVYYSDAVEIAGIYYSQRDFYRKELMNDIEVESNLMILEPYHRTLPAANMSSGTQGTLLWILALSLRMASHRNWQEGWDKQPAILLIDEIENHLHPTWQRRVIPALLEHFPGLQIFATTHSPFVVAGLNAGQVHLLNRDAEGRVTATTNTEDIIGWTADEILRTMMGVDDPTDDATAASARELRRLREEPLRATPEEEEQRQQRILELRQKVDRDLLAGGPMARQREVFEERFARVLERYRESQDLNQEDS